MKRSFIRILCFYFCLLHVIILHAEDQIEYYFKTLDIQNGLSQNTVSSILQDSQGFMWFGTKEGLNRFDGLRFRIFKKETSSLGNDFITALVEDKERNIWIGTDAGIYIYSPLEEKFTYFNIATSEGERIEHTVTHIQAGADNTIWISADFQGLFQYDPINKTLFNHLPRNKQKKPLANVSYFWFDGDTCWLGLYEDNLYYTNDNFKSLTPFRNVNGEESFRHNIITSQRIGTHNCWYIGSNKGLTEINLTTQKVRHLLDCYVRELRFNSDKKLWIGTETGLYIYDLTKNTYIHLTAPDVNDPYALADNPIYSICHDKEGNMWIGSYFGGINYYPYPYTYFKKFYSERNKGFGKRVREFCESYDGTIWIGTEDCGLFHFNPQTKIIEPFKHPSIAHNIHGLALDGIYLWVGTFSGGLNRINLRTKQVKHYKRGSAINTLNSNDIMSICKTSSGSLLIGTIQGLVNYNYNTDDFTSIPQLSNRNINHIFEDSKGDIWISTYANGVYKYDIGEKKLKNFLFKKDDITSLPGDKVMSVYEDSQRRLWIMTQGGGLCQYIAHDDNFMRYEISGNFPSNTIYRMEEDNKKNLWLTTNNGLVCFNPDINYRKTYTTADGLLCNQFNYQSSYKDQRGNIYFGSIDGFISFNPDKFIENTFNPPIVITDLFLFNKHINVGDQGSPLKKSILFSDKLELQSNQNSFSLNVATLGYQSSSIHQLIYYLDGFSKEWYTVGNDNIINFSHLPYGDYTLHLKNITKDTNERILEIHIPPPFYLSKWAYSLYLISVIILVISVLFYYRKRAEKKQQRLIEKIEQKKEWDLYTSKIDFFTNVTHEIRTPLTLIKGPLENILNTENIPNNMRSDLEIMDLNTNRLLDLANQLLDFRKAETQGFQLKFMVCNINDVLQDLYRRFGPLAAQKKIEYIIQQSENIYAFIDREAVTKIMSNLFTNAIKYSDTYIHIKLWKENDCFHLSICNDGQNIPSEMKEEIFKPFTQYKNSYNQTTPGTGIGLTLARSLAELHNGNLYLEDSSNQNCFILTIPIKRDSISVSIDKLIIDEENEDKKISEKKEDNVILIIEDNLDMLSFIARQLSSTYKILTSTNGAEAINILKKHNVDLIISDIMMPGIDGLELCFQLKSDLNYSHIPIILLTAKATLKAKIDGLQSGADAYIEKPFSVELLKTTVNNLLNNREKLRLAFTHSPFVSINSMGVTEAEHTFLKTLSQLTEENMKDPDFNLEKMADLLNMSRSSLHRKIKGSLDMPPNDYIRLTRLKKAAQLLNAGRYRINEVCYMVGFNTPSYFAKCFQKQFGVLPKEFIENKEDQ